MGQWFFRFFKRTDDAFRNCCLDDENKIRAHPKLSMTISRADTGRTVSEFFIQDDGKREEEIAGIIGNKCI